MTPASAASVLTAPTFTAPVAASAPRVPAMKPGAGMDMDAARQAARDFEAVFVGQMVALMFQGLESDKLFGGGQGEQMYRSMMQDEYGKAIARSGGIGIADSVMKTMLKMQENAR